MNEINKYIDKLFKNSLRTGGQIFIENNLRVTLWKSVVVNKIYQYYFFSVNIDKNENQYFIFNFLNRIRSYEKNFSIRYLILRSTAKYFLFFIKNILIEKINNISNKPKLNKSLNLSSLIIHPFSITNKVQKYDYIYKAIEFLAADYKVKKIIDYKSFIDLSIKNIALNIKIIKLFKLINYLIILIIKFFISFDFPKDAQFLIDKFIYLSLKHQKTKSQLSIFTIDPVQNSLIPIFYFLKERGNNICFLSFSLARYYTKSFSDYNGPYSSIISSNVGFKKIVKRSLFTGPIKNSKCYLSLANLKTNKSKNSLEVNSILKIIVVEGVADWYREISPFESKFFTSLLYKLDSGYKNINIVVKKKKNISYYEDYLASEYQDNNIQFSDAVRGFMGDFKERDFILSHGFSSLALKSSELFNKPYIIYDKSENSKNAWERFYGETKVKPFFTNSKNSILRILFEQN